MNFGKETGYSLFNPPFNNDSKSETFPFTYNEKWLDSIKLRKGFFWDTGYRFHYNKYYRRNNLVIEWVRKLFYDNTDPIQNFREFYTIEEFNHHEHPKPLVEDAEAENTPIFDMYFRLFPQQTLHERVRTQFAQDVIAPVYSVYGLSVFVLTVVMGKFLKFLQIEDTINLIYAEDKEYK